MFNSCSKKPETINDLIEKNGLLFKKTLFSEELFTGRIVDYQNVYAESIIRSPDHITSTTTPYLCKYEVDVVNGVKQGYVIGFYVDSNDKAFEFFLKDGKKEGKAKLFFHNMLAKEVNFKNDLYDGEYIEYYLTKSNDKKKKIINFKNGMVEGKVKTFYRIGGIKSEFTVHDNRWVGTYKQYYIGGRLKMIFPQKGECVKYDIDGNIIKSNTTCYGPIMPVSYLDFFKIAPKEEGVFN